MLLSERRIFSYPVHFLPHFYGEPMTDPLRSIDVSPSLSALAMSRESAQVQPTGFDWFL
jgi:hypothetical protein